MADIRYAWYSVPWLIFVMADIRYHGWYSVWLIHLSNHMLNADTCCRYKRILHTILFKYYTLWVKMGWGIGHLAQKGPKTSWSMEPCTSKEWHLQIPVLIVFVIKFHWLYVIAMMITCPNNDDYLFTGDSQGEVKRDTGEVVGAICCLVNLSFPLSFPLS